MKLIGCVAVVIGSLGVLMSSTLQASCNCVDKPGTVRTETLKSGAKISIRVPQSPILSSTKVATEVHICTTKAGGQSKTWV